MIKSIKLKDARELIYQRKGKFVYVDQVDNDPCMEVIFKEKEHVQLYSFWYYCYRSDVPEIGITIDTVQKSDSLLGDDDNLDVEVAPVKKIPVTTYRYVGDDYND